VRPIAALIGALLLAVSCTSGAQVAARSTTDWPMFRGDLSRDGHPPGATLTRDQLKHYKLKWSHTLNGAVDGTPVVVNGLVYAASYGGRLDAYHLDDGAQVWSDEGLGAISGTPAVSGRTLVVGTLTGHVLALDATNGKKLWDWAAPGSRPSIWSSPAVHRRTVIVGVASPYGDTPLQAGRIVALDLATGALRWNFCVRGSCAAGSGVWSSAAVDSAGHGFVGAGNPDDAVVSFDVGSGQRLWTRTITADQRRDFDVGATPLLFQIGTREVVAVGSDGGIFAVLDVGTGKVIWARQLVAGSSVHGLIASPAYDGKTLYVAAASPPTDLFALDSLTGTTRWHRGLGKPIYSAPAVGNGVVVFGAGDPAGGKGGVYGLSTADGSLLFGYDDAYAVLSGPSISGSTVVVGDAGGNVMAFGP
jgi:polyvinyl alcohol dehydrogenase (cytochrome)